MLQGWTVWTADELKRRVETLEKANDKWILGEIVGLCAVLYALMDPTIVYIKWFYLAVLIGITSVIRTLIISRKQKKLEETLEKTLENEELHKNFEEQKSILQAVRAEEWNKLHIKSELSDLICQEALNQGAVKMEIKGNTIYVYGSGGYLPMMYIRSFEVREYFEICDDEDEK